MYNVGMHALNGYKALMPDAMRPRDLEKFYSYISPGDGGCLIWTGTMLRNRPTFRWLQHRTSPARMLLLLDQKIETNDTVVLDCANTRCIKHVKVYTPKQYSERMLRIIAAPPERVYHPQNQPIDWDQ